MTVVTNRQSIADARVASATPGDNLGTSTLLSMHPTSRWSYIKFDTGDLLPEQIVSGRIYIYVTTAGNSSMGVYRVLSNWTEYGITWNNRPSLSAKLCNSVTLSTTGWKYSYNIPVSSIQAQINNGYGFCIYTNSSIIVNCYSREGAAKPYLNLTIYDIPGAFYLQSPANGATVTSPVTLSWSTASGATSYEYRVGTTPGGGTWTNVGNVTNASPTGLLSGVPYYWSVRAVNSEGTRNCDSGEWSFTLGGGQVLIW